MIAIRRVISVLLCGAALACAVTGAAAANRQEVQEQIATCQTVKETAHQMAECARQLGLAEDHPAITDARDMWWDADAKEQLYTSQLASMTEWVGPKLTKSKGVNYGPTGKETYYNLPMQGVVRIMRNMGYSDAEYPYWVREDGVKMLGPYVMVAAHLGIFPRGSLVETSLGTGIVADTGGFAKSNPTQLDIATAWR